MLVHPSTLNLEDSVKTVLAVSFQFFEMPAVDCPSI